MNYNCNFELSQEECLVLLTSLRLLDKLVMGMTIHNENQDELIQNLITKVSQSLPQKMTTVSKSLSNAILDSLLTIIYEEYLKNADVQNKAQSLNLNFSEDDFPPMYSTDSTLPQLQSALVNHDQVKVEYYSLAKESVDSLDLNPLTIIAENNLWKMLAFCHQKAEILNFRIDRIKSVETCNQKFNIPINFNLESNSQYAFYH